MKLSQKPVNELTDEEVRLIIGRQNWLDRIADVDYMCDFLKIDKTEFYMKYVWDWLDHQEVKKTRQNVIGEKE